MSRYRLGLPHLPDLPIVDGDNFLDGDQSAIVEVEHRHTRCFDSRHNVLSPQRVKALANYVVEGVRCGGSQTVVFVSPRAEAKMDTEGEGSRKKKYDASKASGGDKDIDSEVTGKQSRKSTARDVVADGQVPVAASGGGSASGSTGPLGKTPRQAEAKPASASQRSGRSVTSESTTTSVAQGEAALELTAQLIGWTRHKKVAEIKNALANGADVNIQDVVGNTPLIVACQNGHSSLCQYFMEHGADPNLGNKKGNTALHFCFAFGFEDIANFLIANGADEYATNAEGLTCYEGLTKSDLDKF